MNRHPGYSRIETPTAEQLSDLRAALAAGRLTKLLVKDGVAYFRRAPGCRDDDYSVQDDLPARVEKLEHDFRRALVALRLVTKAVTEFADGLTLLTNLVGAQMAPKKPPIDVAAFWLLVFGSMLIGAVLATITK